MSNYFKPLTKTLSNPRVIDSYAGSDVTGDGTFATPYASIARALVDGGTSVNFILGSGTYTEVTNLSALGGGGHSLQGEKGLEKSTIWNLNGGTITITGGGNGWYNLKNLTITNGVVIFYTIVPSTMTCTNVIFKDVELRQTAANNSWWQYFTDCEFINVIGFQSERHKGQYTRCKFINTTIYNAKSFGTGFGCYKLDSCDVDAFSNIQLANEASILELDYNNVRGNLMFQDGTNPDVYVDLATALIEHPTAMGANNINANPLYWDVSKLALIVQSGSPNLGTGKSGVNIGNVKEGIFKFCDIDPELNGTTGTATIVNLVGTTDKTVDLAQATGYIETGVFTINSTTPQVIERIDYAGLIANDYINGISNLPNGFYPAATDGPNILKVEGMFHNGPTPPTYNVDSTFDNGGVQPAGTWIVFALNDQPLIDSTGKGNGDLAYDVDGSHFEVGVKWIKFRITLRRI